MTRVLGFLPGRFCFCFAWFRHAPIMPEPLGLSLAPHDANVSSHRGNSPIHQGALEGISCFIVTGCSSININILNELRWCSGTELNCRYQRTMAEK